MDLNDACQEEIDRVAQNYERQIDHLVQEVTDLKQQNKLLRQGIADLEAAVSWRRGPE